MAGTILIAKGVGLPLSTFEFDYLVERIRSTFRKEDSDFLAKIYEPMDEGGMSFISLIEIGQDGFKAFFSATILAYALEMRASDFSFRKKIWDELIFILRNDPRFLGDVFSY